MIRRNPSARDEQYWVNIEDPELLASEINNRITEFHQELNNLGITALLNRCYTAYYGGDLSTNNTGALFESSKLIADGQVGQLTKYKVNHYRNLIQHVLNLVMAKKRKFTARASNTDAKSQYQTILAKGIVEYYWREKKMNGILRAAAELSLVQLEAWVHANWEPEKGQLFETDPETGAQIYEGDQSFSVHPLHEVIRDLNQEVSPWKILKTTINKWDLFAQYPDLEAVRDEIESSRYLDDQLRYGLRNSGRQKNPDLVTKYILYHEKTPAVPDGKLIEMVGSHILVNLALPYRKIPLYPILPGAILGSNIGYSVGADLVGPQQALDLLNSTILSNQAATGVGLLWTKTNDSITHAELSTGLSHIQSEEPPQGINLTNTPHEIFKNREAGLVDMEKIAGINSTVRGEPPPQATSGTSQALLVSQAVQFASPVEMAVDGLASDLATSIIHNTQDFARTRKVATIVGESKRAYLKEYTPDEIGGIDRIITEEVNPLSQTVAGRVQMADTMMQHGTVTAEQYLAVIETGSLESVTEGTVQEELNIKAENEELRNGNPVPALMTDNPILHIKAHKQVLAAPEDRRNPQVVQTVLDHIQEHLDQWRSIPPELLQVLNIPPPPAPPAPPPGPGGPQEMMEPPSGDPNIQLPESPDLPPGSPVEAEQGYQAQQGAIQQ